MTCDSFKGLYLVMLSTFQKINIILCLYHAICQFISKERTNYVLHVFFNLLPNNPNNASTYMIGRYLNRSEQNSSFLPLSKLASFRIFPFRGAVQSCRHKKLHKWKSLLTLKTIQKANFKKLS